MFVYRERFRVKRKEKKKKKERKKRKKERKIESIKIMIYVENINSRWNIL